MKAVKSLLPVNKIPWQQSAGTERLIAAGGLLFFVLFPLPAALLKIFPQLQIPQASMLASMAGLGVLFLLTPGEMGFDKPSLNDVVHAVMFALAIQLVSAAATALWQVVLDHFNIAYFREQPVADLIKKYDSGMRNLLIFSTCVMAPLLEEILFRRIIYGALLKLGTTAAAFAASLLFAAVHFFLLGLPGLLILGLGFQYIFLKKGNLATAVICHATVNTLACIVLLFV